MATITHPSRLDTRKAAKAIRDWLDQKGFETKALEAQGAYTIKARKESAVRAVLGADRALEVEVRHAGSQTIADVRQGSWKTNIVSNAVWLVATGGMNLAVSGWSVVIQKDLESYIRSLFAELGGVHMVDLTDWAAVRQGQLAYNLSDVPAGNPNLFPCPDCGNSVSRFAAACPQCGRPVALTPEQRAEQQERERQLAAERERLAREEPERQRELAERLAAEREEEERRLDVQWERQRQEELERQREAQRQWEEQKRRWEEWKRKALRWAEERSRATLVAIVSVARWVLRRGDRVLRGLTRHRRDARVRRVLVPTRWWARKADRALRRCSSQLGTLNEAGMRRCLWLVSAIVLILVILAGALVVNRAKGQQELAQRRSHASKAILAAFVFREFHLPPDVDWDKAIAEAAEAIPKCTEEIRLHPQKVRTYQDRGLARCTIGEWEPGIADLTEAIWLDPTNSTSYELRAFVRCALCEWEPAIADLTEAIQLDPKGGKFYALRSVAYAKKGDVERALADRRHVKECMYPMDEVTGLAEVLEPTWPSPRKVKGK